SDPYGFRYARSSPVVPVCLRARLRLIRLPGPGDPALGDHIARLGLRDGALDVFGQLKPRVQHVADEQVVEQDADRAADERPDDRYPEVIAEREPRPVVIGAGKGDL